MNYPDEKWFKYKYDYPPRPLIEFLQDRYYHTLKGLDWDEVIFKRVLINGHQVPPGVIIQPGDQLEYLHLRQDEEDLSAELPVLFEDEHILAISKPDHLPVSPSGRYYYHSLAILARERFQMPELSPLHRLDLETSGVLLFGKSKWVRKKLQPLFQKRMIEKYYQAVCFHQPQIKKIEGDMQPAKESRIFSKQELVLSPNPKTVTLVEKSESWGDFFRVWLQPLTGKTNQIRVHLAWAGCPIVGDKKYFPAEEVFLDWYQNRDIKRILPQVKLRRQALHHELISFVNPITNQQIEIADTTNKWDTILQDLLHVVV